MKAKCTITRKEFKKLLLKKRNETNTLYLTLFSVVFFILCFKLIIYNFLFMILLYVFSLIFMSIVLYIVNIIYTNVQLNISESKVKNSYGEINVEATDEYLSENSDTASFKIYYKDVKYSRFKKDYFMIVDNTTALMLRKSFFKSNDEYIKMRNYVKNNVKGMK